MLLAADGRWYYTAVPVALHIIVHGTSDVRVRPATAYSNWARRVDVISPFLASTYSNTSNTRARLTVTILAPPSTFRRCIIRRILGTRYGRTRHAGRRELSDWSAPWR